MNTSTTSIKVTRIIRIFFPMNGKGQLLLTDENREATSSKQKFPYVDKWLSNEQINQKLSNHFWKNDKVPDTQITQNLKFRYAQYMGNHRKNIFWPLKYQNPNCTLCRPNERDTWPHLLSTCKHPYLESLRIARHNKASQPHCPNFTSQ